MNEKGIMGNYGELWGITSWPYKGYVVAISIAKLIVLVVGLQGFR